MKDFVGEKETIQAQIRQLENRQKVLLNKKTDAERKARTRRLIERGAILESVFPAVFPLSNEEVVSLLSDIFRLPVAIYHCSIKIIKRSEGRSAVAAAAYRTGQNLTNEWDGMTHDYTKKGGVVHTEIMLPFHATPDFSDRSALWNSSGKHRTHLSLQPPMAR